MSGSHKKKNHSHHKKHHRKQKDDEIPNTNEQQALLSHDDDHHHQQHQDVSAAAASLGIHNELDINRSLQKATDPHPVLPVVGEVMAYTNITLFAFTAFLALKLDGYLSWNWWLVCTPLWALLFLLLVLTQSKRMTRRAPLIVRLAWLIIVLSIIVFLVALNMKFTQTSLGAFEPTYSMIFMPLWCLFAIVALLGLSGVIVGIVAPSHEPRRRKYLLAGVPLIVFDAIFFPFILLTELKLRGEAGYAWGVVFIPLWITDAFFFCGAILLLVFTVGASEDAMFSLSQVITFLGIMPISALFKVLLVLWLDEILTTAFLAIFAPLLLVELLFFTCGVNINIREQRKRRRKKKESLITQSTTHTELKGQTNIC